MNKLKLFPNVSYHSWMNILSIIVLLAVLLASCGLPPSASDRTPTPTLEKILMDQSLLTDQPCEAPCWYSLEPSISSKGDALIVVQNLPFIDPKETTEEAFGYWDATRRENLPARFIRLKCRQPESWSCAGLVLVDDIVMSIYLFPNYDLTFKEVVEHLGPPDYVQVVPYHAEAPPFCNVALIWLNHQVIIDFRVGAKREKQVRCSDFRESGMIDPDLPVDQVSYVAKEDTRLMEPFEPKGYYPWKGFEER